ncbi:hypothetical protein DCI44_003868 [Escherichia coli]|nr:hypothetical protein [Escherichia coli]
MLKVDAITFFGSKTKLANAAGVRLASVAAWGILVPEGRAMRLPLDDEKSVHERVDNARIDLRSKYYVKPKADHPWLTRRTQSHQQVKPPKLPKKKPDPDKKD